jgi:membrane protease YdiL (CAAX protease family)
MPATANPVLRVAIIWTAVLAVFLGKTQFAVLLFGPDYTVSRHIVMALTSTALTVPLIVLARRYLDREPFAGLGLAIDLSALRPLFVGALAWLAPFALALATCLALGLVEIRAVAPWSEILAFVPLLLVLVFLLEALPEELAFRGYLQTNLGRLLAPWLAVAAQAALFGSWGVALWLVTSGGLDPLHASLFYVMGALLGALRIITGSVWTGIGFHLAFQTMAQLLLNAERGHFAIDGAFWLQVIALGAVPFSLAVPIVERFYRDTTDWTVRPASST